LSITINRLILDANTADGPYGLDIPFSEGLFILRVENTHGKSTCINSIAYALGMEMALGQQTSKPPFPPSLLKSIQDENGSEKLVVSSYVMLEISNDRGQTVTLKRSILGADADSIVTLYNSEINSITGDGENHFLHKEGDTTRNLGFYSWLASFIGWELPLVPNNSGKDTPLYPALLFPLFFVEQKKGWGAIQATTPFHFQISQAKKRAFEFIMDLDVNEIVKKKAKNKNLSDDVQEKWKLLYVQIENAAIRLGGKINGVKNIPSAKFEQYKVDILLEYKEEWQSLSSTLEKYRAELLLHISTSQTPTIREHNENKLMRIRKLNIDLIQEENKYEALSGELSFVQNQVEATQIRIENLVDDKRKYEDLRKVKSFQVLNNLPILNNECPTCGREYSDHSVELECSDELMTLEESLDFIKSQISTFKSVLHSYSTQLDIKTLELSNLEKVIYRHTAEASLLKQELYSDDNVIDEGHLREKIRLENLIKDHEEALINIADFRNEFDKLHVKYKELTRLRRGFPEHGFSTNDSEKLNALQRQVIGYLSDFGFSSFDSNLLNISSDSYLPTREGFDLGFDTSASDGIRVIWSYLISLFSLREKFQTNHPGIIIFDEPRQQEANKLSFAGLLRGASETSSAGQIIFATSEEEKTLTEALEGCKYSLLSFSPSEGKILRKL
jgi:hypothetical protein